MIDFDIIFVDDTISKHIIYGATFMLLAAAALFFVEFFLPKRRIDELEVVEDWEIETIIWSPSKRPPRRRRQKVNWRKEGF